MPKIVKSTYRLLSVILAFLLMSGQIGYGTLSIVYAKQNTEDEVLLYGDSISKNEASPKGKILNGCGDIEEAVEGVESSETGDVELSDEIKQDEASDLEGTYQCEGDIVRDTSAFEHGDNKTDSLNSSISCTAATLVEKARGYKNWTKSMFGFTTDWCVLFVKRVVGDCGFTVGTSGRVTDFIQQGISNGSGVFNYYALGAVTPNANCRSVDRKTFVPQRGDFVCFTWDGVEDERFDHIGIVTDVTGRVISFIDGNSKAGNYTNVVEHSNKYKAGSGVIMGYFRPNYTDSVPVNNPIGCVDVVKAGVGTIRVRGWAFDRDDYSEELSVHVYIGNEGCRIIANKERSDVNNSYGCGNYHGFDEIIAVKETGNLNIEIEAVNIGGGENTTLKKTTVYVEQGNKPQGNVDKITVTPGWINVSGWAFDKDEPSKSIEVIAYLGDKTVAGNYYYPLETKIFRSDVNSTYGIAGNHGFNWDLNTGEKQGTFTLYFYAVDTGSNYGEVLIDSRQVTVTPYVNVEGVEIKNYNGFYYINSIGGTIKLYCNTIPSNATNTEVEWSSSDTSIATVDSNGKVTAKKEGSVYITVKTKEGGFADRCLVKVSPGMVVYGDCDGNGQVTITDLSVMNQGINGRITFSEADKVAFDLDGDGDVDKDDYDLLNKYIVGKISRFPVEDMLNKIVIYSLPTKTIYYEGDEISYAGIKVKAYYNDGTSRIVTPIPRSLKAFQEGSQTIPVVYEEGGVTKLTACYVQVYKVKLSGISIATKPVKTTYVEGETFDKTGMVVKALYNNGTTKVVTNYDLSINRVLNVSDESIEISYDEDGEHRTATQIITVKTYCDVNGHNWGSCIPDGNRAHIKTCKLCGVSQTGKCSFTKYHIEPTCTANSYDLYECAECGNSYKSNIGNDAIGHSYYVKEAEWTKTSDSYDCAMTLECEKCNEKEDGYRNRGEAKVTSSVTKQSTCTDTGIIQYSAVYLGKVSVKTVTSPKLPHTFEWIIDQEATEEREGLKHQRCRVCGYEQSMNTSIAKLSHVHSLKMVEGKAATCTEGGNITYYKCEGCGGLFSDDSGNNQISEMATRTEALGHQMSIEWSTDARFHYHKCLRCNARDNEQEHTYEIKNTDKGIRQCCTVCEYYDDSVIVPSGISINPGELTLTKGETANLTPVVLPENVTDRTVNWRSSDDNIVEVDSNGIITAREIGQAYIIAEAKLGGAAGVSVVSVIPKEEDPETFTIVATAGEGGIIEPDGTKEVKKDDYQVYIITEKDGYTIDDVIVDGESVGAVRSYVFNHIDSDHTITALFRQNIVKISDIVLDKNQMTLVVGQTGKLTETIFPDNASNKSVSWNSSNSSVASVDQSGVVFGKAKGTARITVTTEDGGYTYGCVVTVSEENEEEEEDVPDASTYRVVFYNGSTEISNERVPFGETVTNLPENMGDGFIGWYIDGEDKLWDSTRPITRNYSLYAKFREELENGEQRSGRDPVQIAKDEHVYLVKGQSYAFDSKDDKGNSIVWKSTDSSIVKVSSKYKVKALRATSRRVGMDSDTGVYIFCGENESDYTVRYTVHVIDPYITEINDYGKYVVGKSAITLTPGSKHMLFMEADGIGENDRIDDYYEISWDSSNEEVAKVEDGEVYTLKKGTARIYSYIGGRAYSCTIKVVDTMKPGILEGEDSITLVPLQTATLRFVDKSFKTKNLTWKNQGNSMKIHSKNNKVVFYQDSVVRVTPSGKITAVGTGTTTLTAISKDKSGDVVSKTFTVKVGNPVNQVVYLNKGKSKQIRIYGVKNSRASWIVASDEMRSIIGNVKNGKIKGEDIGIGKVTCKYNPYAFEETTKGFEFSSIVYVEKPMLAGDVTDMNTARTSGKLNLEVGDTAVIKVSNVYQPVHFTSNKPNVVFVDEAGIVNAREKGKACLTTRVNGLKLNVSVNVR